MKYIDIKLEYYYFIFSSSIIYYNHQITWYIVENFVRNTNTHH